ncbi:hypothetical protein BKA70DRAFT_1449975 [Coprinopsis sp. MPI-PUGE-AT-0042]|nr:hypothetical protein BKA70DRAFT_1449975 [Coprinopsis sp. MPI-PUGE-AT-0042]
MSVFPPASPTFLHFAEHAGGSGEEPNRLSNSSSISGTLVNQEWDDCDTPAGLTLEAKGDLGEPPTLSAILASAGLATQSSREQLSPERLQVILHQHTTAMIAYHVTLELQRVSSCVLAQMRDQQDALFGEGMWLLRHTNDLGEAHRQMVDQVMGAEKWDKAYQEQWRSIAEKLLLLIEPCLFHGLL